MTNLEIPTIGVLGSLVRSGIRAFVYRYSDTISLSSLLFNYFISFITFEEQKKVLLIIDLILM